MELADPKLIAYLSVVQTERKHVARRGTQESIKPVRTLRVRRCRCGECPRCVENARWDRIFNEKFADPEYYAAKPVRFGSTLDRI